MQVIDFLYDRIGQYLAPGEDKLAWALSEVLSNKDGKKVSFRGPGRSAVLVSESGVWVQTKYLPPPNLPGHIHWGAERIFGMAVRGANDLGAWYGIRFSVAGPEKFVSQHSLNLPGSDVFALHEDSGRQTVFWKPALVNELIELVCSAFPVADAKTVFSLADYAAGGPWRGRPLTRDQERVAKTVYNLLAKEQPEVFAFVFKGKKKIYEGRRGLSDAIAALTANDNSVTEDLDSGENNA